MSPKGAKQTILGLSRKNLAKIGALFDALRVNKNVTLDFLC